VKRRDVRQNPESAKTATFAGRQDDIAAGRAEPPKSGETSSTRHALVHQYAANHDQFPGWLEQGCTAQSVGRPVILAEASVGSAAVSRADKRTSPRRRKAESSN
jgi:hypothetical protein